MGLIRYYCVIFKKKKTCAEAFDNLKALDFPESTLRPFVLDSERMEMLNEYSDLNYEIDTIYSSVLRMQLGGEDIGFDILLIDGEQTYIYISAMGEYSSNVCSDYEDYFISKFKALPDCQSVISGSDLNDYMDIYSFKELKRYFSAESEYPLYYLFDPNG
jgi:hypothetical protein